MRYSGTLLFLLIAFSINHSFAQSQGQIYLTDGAYISSIKVTMDGKEKKLAWSGGLNNPQPALADLNKDGKPDLVIYEPNPYWNGKCIKTFINKGTPGNPDFYYAPEYEWRFPANIWAYLKMYDYNCDNAADIFHFGNKGLAICDGYYDTSNSLNFKPCKNIEYVDPTWGTTPVVVLNGDIPDIVDVDNDGDLDMVTFSGDYKIWYYRNQREEKGYPCDTFAVQMRDYCWGKIAQGTHREHILGVSCDNTVLNNQPKTTHGANTLRLFDADGDGDKDALNGNGLYSDIQYYHNGKVEYNHPVDSMISQDTLWQSGGKQLYMPNFPLAFALDIDQDNDDDILASPLSAEAENYRCLAHYENTGTATNPNFVYQGDTFIVDKMIDLGSASYPFLYDYNRDGKKDLFIGGRGRRQANGTFKTAIYYFENTSVAPDISFSLVTRNFLNIEAVDRDGGALAIGDIDNDGLDDLLVGRVSGTMSYYKNTAASAGVQPVWQLIQKDLKDGNGAMINIGNYATPLIYDIDKDGKKDIIIGNYTGHLTFYKNNGGAAPNFEYVTNKLGNVKVVHDQLYGYSAPFIGKMDNTGNEYLVVGGVSGRLYRFDGFQNGNVSTPYTMIDSMYSYINLPGMNAAPFIEDLNGDGKYEMFIGNEKGGVFLYRQFWNVNVPDVKKIEARLKIYPNPAGEQVTIAFGKDIPAGAILRIYNAMGQVMHGTQSIVNGNELAVNISSLPAGVYICTLSIDGTIKTGMFTKE